MPLPRRAFPLPVRDSRFPSPKAGASDLPLSKTTGNPNQSLAASGPTTATPAAVSPIKSWRDKVSGAFQSQDRARKILAQGPLRDAARLALENRDRQTRFRSARVPVLGTSRMSGFDWIRHGRRLNPAVPGGVNGLVQATRNPSVRGSSADAARVPAGTLERLAAKARLRDAVPTVFGRRVVPSRQALKGGKS